PFEMSSAHAEDSHCITYSLRLADVDFAIGKQQVTRGNVLAEFADGRAEIVAFLTRKWAKELDYRLIKERWAFADNRIAVRYAYEWHDDSGNWLRSCGNENWEYDAVGLMQRRFACINDLPIEETDRKFHWPLGRRPDDHPGELGL